MVHTIIKPMLLAAVPPSEFIPVAEQTGLILTIGEWVLRSGCAPAKAWHEERLPVARIAVNVSGL
jgi:EAL domain-containing protein (putative c-di-GMP-specific phosphodiesterase class I)